MPDSEDEVNAYYAKVTPAMVQASLAKDRHDWFDLLNLLSPAAYPFMDAMRKKARLARIKYYGKTVSVYAPLYIGNTCINSCRYCDPVCGRCPHQIIAWNQSEVKGRGLHFHRT